MAFVRCPGAKAVAARTVCHFLAIEPHATGMLPVTDGNEIYWEASGNPDGRPALFLHGGPGAPMSGGYRRNFDPDVWRIVYLDQRGCGRSRPLAHEDLTSLATNTTARIARRHRGAARASRRRELAGRRRVLGRHAGARVRAAASAPGGRAGARGDHHDQRRVRRVDHRVDAAVFPREWDAFAAASGRRPGQRVVDAFLAPDHRPGPGRARRGGAGVVRLGGRARLAGPGLDAVRAVRRSRCSAPSSRPSSSTTGRIRDSCRRTGSCGGCPPIAEISRGDDPRPIRRQRPAVGGLGPAQGLARRAGSSWSATGTAAPAMSEAITTAVASFA